jgi:hypothetical protein
VITELGGPVFEFTHDLIGDLFSAKNAGVTNLVCKGDCENGSGLERSKGGS